MDYINRLNQLLPFAQEYYGMDCERWMLLIKQDGAEKEVKKTQTAGFLDKPGDGIKFAVGFVTFCLSIFCWYQIFELLYSFFSFEVSEEIVGIAVIVPSAIIAAVVVIVFSAITKPYFDKQYQKILAEKENAVAAVKEEIGALEDKMRTLIRRLKAEGVFEFIPTAYFKPEAILYFIKAFERMWARDLREAIMLYESEHQRQQDALMQVAAMQNQTQQITEALQASTRTIEYWIHN